MRPMRPEPEKVGFNRSGSWQGGTSQTIVKGQVFLVPAATVHWHFHKKDYWANRNRVQEEGGGDGGRRAKDNDSGERDGAIINCH